MLGRRIFRVSAALFVASASAMLVWPRVTGIVSTSATVNAPIHPIRAPFDGQIVAASGDRAAVVLPGQTLIRVRPLRQTSEEVLRLMSEREATAGRREALDAQIAAYADLAARLRDRLARETVVALALVAGKVRREEVLFAASRAREDRLAAALARAERLRDTGVLPLGAVDEARNAVDAARADAAGHEAALALLRIEAEALGDNPGGTPLGAAAQATRQRIDEIDLRLIDLRAQRQKTEREFEAISGWLAAARDEVARTSSFSPEAAGGGVIWSPSQAAPAPVTAGQDLVEVLDCGRRFVEVVVSERFFERIPHGSVATVRLAGSTDTFDAPVIALRGLARDETRLRPAALDRSVPGASDGVTLFLALPAADVTDPAVASAFCDVGRSAEVRIAKPAHARLALIARQVSAWLGLPDRSFGVARLPGPEGGS